MSEECRVCGVGEYLPSRVCDHCNSKADAPRPIETAPKTNETRILLFHYDAWHIGYWCDVGVEPGYTQWMDDYEEFHFMLPGPTHWLPLPPNPRTQSNAAKSRTG